MFVEIHILQNFVPANLNRSDTNAPKDCEFGGYRRARISSQCLKRAVRTAFKEDRLLPPEDLGIRTKRLSGRLTELMAAQGRPAEEAAEVAETALAGLEIAKDSKQTEKTQYLLFLGDREVQGLAAACLAHWDELREVAAAVAGGKDKKGKKAGIPADVVKALEAVLDGGRAADVALFGRMLADLPEKNVDAAGQVAHALSTNRVETDFDFYTAVDDLKPEDTAGADMLGTVEFNSACFYRYANVDTDQLLKNLGQDASLAQRTLAAWLQATIQAVPTGKQNSMAAHNPPSLVLAVVREHGLQNLANAFARPVAPNKDGDLVENSISRLREYWHKLEAMYGTAGLRGTWLSSTDSVGEGRPSGTGWPGGTVPVSKLVAATVAEIPFAGGA